MTTTTINDIQDLVRILEDRPEWRGELQRILLTQELLETPARLNALTETVETLSATVNALSQNVADLTEAVSILQQHAEATNKRLDKLEETVAALVLNAEATNRRLDRLTAETRVNTRHIGEMRGLFAAQKVIREALLIADRIGLRSGRALETQEIIDIWNLGADKGLTQGIAKSDEESFKTADLVIEARTSEGERRYIAVEISYTANGREVRRAARNAGYISSFSEVPTYAVAAGMFKDDRIEERLTMDEPQPYAGNAESPIYWSRHTDIDRPE